MVFKINIGTPSGKTYKLETESQALVGKELGDKISGKDLANPDFTDYEFEITGTSDKSGFTSMKDVEGIGLKKVLLKYGKAMHKRPRREGKKKLTTPKPSGLRLRKTVRGKTISDAIVQINLKLVKEGSKKLDQIFAPAAPENTEEKTEEKKE